MNQDFLDVLRELLGTESRFLVVGAFALSVHAEPRATGDLDIWVEAAPENAKRVYQALKDFGAPLKDLTVDDLSKPGIVFQMGLPPNRIDILTKISGVTFEEAWTTRVTIDISGLNVPVIGKELFLVNKKAAGRPKDLLDVDLVEKHSPPPKKT
ncbi:MAG TPA: hypothetical protein VI895_13345 [Bdellovibrionota bacterium]|nr:hypothetical protein [Bdellovibrionota bacterium]